MIASRRRLRRAFLAALACSACYGVSAYGNGLPGGLMTLMRAGDHAGLQRLLAQGENPNRRLADGSLPLAWAIERQDPELVRLLLDYGAHVNDPHPDANLFRPLIVACRYPRREILQALLELEPEVDAVGPDAISALSLCAAHASRASVARLLALGATVEAVDALGRTPLMYAAAHGRLENFRLLLAAGADVNRTTRGGFTPLLFAIKSGSSAVARAALDAGGDPSATAPDGTSAVQLAMYQGNYGFAATLIELGVDLHAYDRNGRQLLHAAVLAAQPALVRQLLREGADVNALTGESVVPWRYESNFRAGPYEFPTRSPLLLAADAGLADMLRLLADAGADVGQRDPDGNNLVLTAAASGVPEALAVALELAPDANVRNGQGQTPLHRVLASATGPVLERMLSKLAASGAEVDLADHRGRTAADIAGDEHFKGREAFAELFAVTGE